MSLSKPGSALIMRRKSFPLLARIRVVMPPPVIALLFGIVVGLIEPMKGALELYLESARNGGVVFRE